MISKFFNGNIDPELKRISGYSTRWGLASSFSHVLTTASLILAIAEGVGSGEDAGLKYSQIAVMAASISVDCLLGILKTKNLFKTREQRLLQNIWLLSSFNFKVLTNGLIIEATETIRDKIIIDIMGNFSLELNKAKREALISRIDATPGINNDTKAKIVEVVRAQADVLIQQIEQNKDQAKKILQQLKKVTKNSVEKLTMEASDEVKLGIFPQDKLEEIAKEFCNKPELALEFVVETVNKNAEIAEDTKKEIIKRLKKQEAFHIPSRAFFQWKAYILPSLGLVSGLGLAISGIVSREVLKKDVLETAFLASASVASDLFATVHSNIAEKEIEEIREVIRNASV